MASLSVPSQVRDALGKHLKENVLAAWAEESTSAGDGDLVLACYHKFLLTDLRFSAKTDPGVGASSAGEASVSSRQSGVLEGTRIVQVNESWNCAAPAKHRYDKQAYSERNRCLKMHCTDGRQDFVAMEYEYIPSLRSDAAAGTKILVKDAPIRKGALLLSPSCVHVLGGEVKPLELANQRKFQRWNEVVSGQLGIKKEQHVDSITKLQSAATEAALGGRVSETSQANPRGPNPSVAPREPLVQGSAGAPDVRSSGVSQADPRQSMSTAPFIVGNTPMSSTMPTPPRAVIPDTPVSVSGNASTYRDSDLPTPPRAMISLSEPRVMSGCPSTSPTGAENPSGRSPQTPPGTTILSDPNLTITPPPARRRRLSHHSLNSEGSFRLPAYAAAAADEMAERGTDDVVIHSADDVTPPRGRCDFIASQAAEGTQAEAETDRAEADRISPVIDLISESESGSQRDPSEGDRPERNPGGEGLGGEGDERRSFSSLRDLEAMVASSKRASVRCSINDFVSFSMSAGEYRMRIAIEDGTGVREVSVCHDLVQRLFGKTPRELEAMPAGEKAVLLQEKVHHRLMAWDGRMEIETREDLGLTAISMQSQESGASQNKSGGGSGGGGGGVEDLMMEDEDEDDEIA